MSYLALAKKVQAEIKPVVEAKPQSPALDQLVDENVIAILIDSTVLGAPVWLAFSPAFVPGDGIPVFYADELQFLKDKPVETLRILYETKRIFGLRTRLKQ